MYRNSIAKEKCSPQRRTALYLAKRFGWRASNHHGVGLPHNFNLTPGHYKVENNYPKDPES